MRLGHVLLTLFLILLFAELSLRGTFFLLGKAPSTDQNDFCSKTLSPLPKIPPDGFDSLLGWTTTPKTFPQRQNLTHAVAVVGDFSSMDDPDAASRILAALYPLLNDTSIVDYTVVDHNFVQTYLRYLFEVRPKQPDFTVLILPITSIKKNALLCGTLWYRPSAYLERDKIFIQKMPTTVPAPRNHYSYLGAFLLSPFVFS